MENEKQKAFVRESKITGVFSTSFTEDSDNIIRRINGLELFNLDVKELESIAVSLDELCVKFKLSKQDPNDMMNQLMDIRDNLTP